MRTAHARSNLRPGVVAHATRRSSLVAAAVVLLFPSIALALPPLDSDRETPDRAYRRLFISVRAYPDSVINPVARDSAFSRMKNVPMVHLSPIRGGTPAWRSIGPTNVGGRVTDLAIDPSNGARWFATTVGGVWRTTDAGHRWRRVSDQDASGAGMRPGVFGAVVVVPGSGEVIVGGGDPNRFETDRSGGPGLWHSTNAGDSWTQQSAPGVASAVVFRLRVGPPPDRNVYAATSNGLYWRHLVSGTPTWEAYPQMSSPCCDVLVDDRTTPATIEVATYTDQYRDAGIWRRSGSSWTKISPNFGSATVGPIALARAPSKPDVLYARVSRRGDPVWRNTLLHVYRSVDNGNSWTNVTPATPSDPTASAVACGADVNVVNWDDEDDNPPYAGYNNSLAVDPADENVVYCGGRRLLRSADGGATWCVLALSANANYQDVNAPTPWYGIRNSVAHDDVHAITFDSSVGRRRVIVADDGGVHGLEADLPLQNFFWTDLNHGLNVTEFYRLATQQAQQSITAGGTQDNGSLVTYGSRTWFHGYPCDTQEIAVDAAYGSTLYGHCNWDDDGKPFELNVVPSVVPGSDVRETMLPTNREAYPPVAASLGEPRHLLASSRDDPPLLLQAIDGTTFTDLPNGALKHGADLTALARVDAKGVGWYAAFADDRAVTGTIDPGINACPDPSQAPITNSFSFRPNAIAVDPAKPLMRAVVATNGADQSGNIMVTENGGGAWTTTPIASPATGVAWDPTDPDRIWIATDVAVLRARVSGSSVGNLERCMDGLPDPISVNDIRASKAGTITIGTMGYGAYQIDLAPDAVTEDVALCVRDDVFDHGKPFTPGMPDPEHPVPDPADPRYRTAASGGAGLQFFNSTDIRVDVPTRSEPRNQVDVVDNVSFESTPIEIPYGFCGTIVDRSPHAGDQARVYVQVTNFGADVAHDVRVYVMWRDPTVGPLSLPADFWTTTLPGPGPTCGPLNPTSGWHALSGLDGSACVVLPEIRPEMPEVAGFAWSVPSNVPPHVCMVAFVESAEDPLEPTLRGVLDLATLVPQSRHFAQRNLYPVDAMAAINTELIRLTDKRHDGFRLRFDRVWLDRTYRLAAILPPGTHGPIHGMHTAPPDVKMTEGLKKSGLDWSTMFVADSSWCTIDDIRLNRDAPRSMLIVYSRQPKSSGRGQRFMVRTEQGDRVLGGATWVLRPSVAVSREKPKRKAK